MISILHLSDLRIAQSGQWNNLRSCILEQARRVRSRPRGEKLLVLTGDFRNFEDSDYSKAEAFLTQLFAAMGIDPATDVFVVPGNHDVGNDVLMEQCFPGDSRWKTRQRYAVAYLKTYDSSDEYYSYYIGDRMESYRPFCQFLKKLGIPDADGAAAPHVRQWPASGEPKLNLFHLNTTLVADGGKEKDNQRVDLLAATNDQLWKDVDPSLPALALGHNSFFDLDEVHQTALEAVFRRHNVCAYLCGDTHKEELDRDRQRIRLTSGYSDGVTIPNIVGVKGAADDSDKYSDFGLYWHDWDEEKCEVHLRLLSWEPEVEQAAFLRGRAHDYNMPRKEIPQRDETERKRSISYLERKHFLDDLRLLSRKGKRFCFILGAGASISSGIPSGKMMMMDWRKTLLDKTEEELRFLCERSNVPWREWERIRQLDYDFPGEDYFTLYDLCYGSNPQEGKRYLTRKMREAQPSRGYYLLAKLMNGTGNNVVITTNFDHLTEEAFTLNHLGFPQVLDANTAHEMQGIPPEIPIVAKVHGDAMLNPLNRSRELKKLAPVWRERLSAIFASYIPIVIGYVGGDRTLMAYLEECGWLKRVYWCSVNEKETDTIEQFLQAEDMRYLVPMNREGSPEEIGFDGIMAEIYDALMPAEASVQKVQNVLSREKIRNLTSQDTIKTLVFRNTIAGAPEGDGDVSEAGNRGILCWRKGNTLTIAGEGGVGLPKSCKELFQDWKALRTVTGAELLDTSRVTDMSGLFDGCGSLQTLEVGSWNTGNVTDMFAMFRGCGRLQTLEVGSWNTGNVESMFMMFGGCGSLQTLEVSSWNTGNVKTMRGMFNGCDSIEILDVGSWNTGNVTDMSWMFDGCGSLQTLDIRSWNTGNVTDMSGMFFGCGRLQTLEVGSWNTGNVKTMSWMFRGCGSLKRPDIDSWDTGKVTDLSDKSDLYDALDKSDILDVPDKPDESDLLNGTNRNTEKEKHSEEIKSLRQQIDEFFQNDARTCPGYYEFLNFLRNHNSSLMREIVSDDLRYLFKIAEDDTEIIPYYDDQKLQNLFYQIYLIDSDRIQNSESDDYSVSPPDEPANTESHEGAENEPNKNTDKNDQPEKTTDTTPSDLEIATLYVLQDFEKWLIEKLDREGKKYEIIKSATRQKSGDQYGYDVGMTIRYDGATFRLCFECKHYLTCKHDANESEKTLVAGKYALNLLKFFINSEIYYNNRWVLVCPYGNLQNDYPEKLFEAWNKKHSHLKIYAITESESGLICRDFLSTNERAYQLFYPDEPKNEVSKEEVFEKIREHFIGVDHVSNAIKKALKPYQFGKEHYPLKSALLSVLDENGKDAFQEIMRSLKEIRSAEAHFKSHRDGIYIIGEYGTGKTWLLLRTIEEIIRHPADYPFVPVLFRLKEYKQSDEENGDNIHDSVKDFARDTLQQFNALLDESSSQSTLQLFLLDGFDEVLSGLSATNQKVTILDCIINEIKLKYPKSVFIITSRESDYNACQTNRDFKIFNNYDKLLLGECRAEEVKNSILAIRDTPGLERYHDSLSSLAEKESLIQFARRPVYKTLLVNLALNAETVLADITDEYSLLERVIETEIQRCVKEAKETNAANTGNLDSRKLKRSLREALFKCALDCTRHDSSEAALSFQENEELRQVIPVGIVSVRNNTAKCPWSFKKEKKQCTVSFLHNIVREFLVAKYFCQLLEKAVNEEEKFFEKLRAVQMSPASLRFFQTALQKNLEGEACINRLKEWLCRDKIKKESVLSRRLLEMLLQPGCTLSGSPDMPLNLSGIEANNLCIWNCTIKDVNFSGAVLKNMQLINTELNHVDFQGADLTGLRLAPAKPICDFQHWKHGAEWILAVLYQNGQVLKYTFSNRFTRDSYSVTLLDKADAANGIFRLNSKQYLASGNAVYPFEAESDGEAPLYQMRSKKQLQRIITGDKMNSIAIDSEHSRQFHVLLHNNSPSNTCRWKTFDLSGINQGHYCLFDSGFVLLERENTLTLYDVSDNHTYQLWKLEDGVIECFTVHSLKNGESEIYVKLPKQLLRLSFDSKLVLKVQKTYSMVEDRTTLTEISFLTDGIFAAAVESSIYILALEDDKAVLHQLNTAVKCVDVRYADGNGQNRMRDDEAYSLLSGSTIVAEQQTDDANTGVSG